MASPFGYTQMQTENPGYAHHDGTCLVLCLDIMQQRERVLSALC